MGLPRNFHPNYPWSRLPRGAHAIFASDRGLSLLSGGTFTRASEGSYLTGAPTDGSAAFLAWAANDVRRVEDRGDGLGAMLLMEGSSTSRLLRSFDFTNAAWTAAGLTATGDTNNAPDGTASADTLAFTASATAQISQPFTSVPADAAIAEVTVWLRAAAPQTVRLFIRQKDGATEGAAVSCAVTTTWQRFELKQSVGAGASAPLLIIRNHSDAAARSVFAWDATVECSAAFTQFPTSTIRTTAAAVTRASDFLQYAAGQYPDSFRTRGYQITFVPDFSSAETVAGNFASGLVHPFTSGLNDSLYLSLSGPNAIVVIRANAAATFTTVTYARGQVCTIRVEPNANRITLSGFLTGNGAQTLGGAWTIASGPLYVGNFQDTTSPFCGRLSPTIVGL